jgi:O-acetyl-ADP-ribose deacetylase (regulator of RNase III)
MAQKTLTLTQGDITLLPLEDGALVNPSNTGMILGSGVGEAITRRAGPFIQQKLHMKRSKLDENRLEPGRAVETEAGQLSAEWLIHVSILGSKDIDRRLIGNCIRNAYNVADRLGVKTIAFPPLGVELAGYPMEEFLDLFHKVTDSMVPSMNALEHVILCCQEEAGFEEARTFLEETHEEWDEAFEFEVSASGMGASLM